MAQVTDPNLLAQLEGGAPAPTSAVPAGPQASQAPQTPSQGSGKVEDAALLAQLNAGSSDPQGAPQAPAGRFPSFDNQADLNTYLAGQLNDPKVKTQDIRDFYSSIGAKIDEHTDAALQARDKFLAVHHDGLRIGVDPTHVSETVAPGQLVDNRPMSYTQGLLEGAEHVGTNVIGGLGFLGNKVGLTNNIGDDARQAVTDFNSSNTSQGHPVGKLVGEMLTAAPAMALSAPVEAGAGAIGAGATLARGLGMLGSGAASGALVTNATTPGGVARDAAIGAGANLALGGVADAAGRVLTAGGGRLAPTAAATQGREVLDAADRLTAQGGPAIRPTPAMTGGVLSRGLNALGEAGVGSNIPIANKTEAVVNGLRAARDRVAQSLAPAGSRVRSIEQTADNVLNNPGGLGEYEQASGKVADKMYEAAEKATAGTNVPTPKALAEVNAIISEMKNTPGEATGIRALEALRDDLTPSPDIVNKPSLFGRLLGKKTTTIKGDPAEYAIGELRRLRTQFGDNVDANQRYLRDAANRIWGPLSEDIQDGLRAKGKDGAANLYKDADSFYKNRVSNINDVVNPILGNRSSEQLGGKLISMSRTDSDRLDKALSLMSPDQAAHVRASIVGDLGNANPGVQNVAGDAFSPQVFHKDFGQLRDATSDTFTGGAHGQDLQDIARVGQSVRDAGALRNTSGTGRVAHGLGQLGKLASGIQGLHTLGLSLGAEYAGGAAVSSNRIARGLVNMGTARPVATITTRSLTQAPKSQVAWDKLLQPDSDQEDK